MYISIFKTEVSSKLKPNSISQSSFNYQYGVRYEIPNCILFLSVTVCSMFITTKFKISRTSNNFSPCNTYLFDSFLLYVSGFICVEVSGTCAVLLFVYQDQTVQSVHFIQPSPVIYRNYSSTANPGTYFEFCLHIFQCFLIKTVFFNL